MPLPTIFQLHPGGQHYWWVEQTLSHNVVSNTPRLSGIRTHKVIGDRH